MLRPPEAHRLGRSLRILLLSTAFAACSATRPEPPPAGASYTTPVGAIPIDESWKELDEAPRLNQLVEEARSHLRRIAESSGDEPVPYRVLALSGGGSRGAYGAGVLVGWTETGRRPEFNIVTGISTGALIATFAFLGPEYDESLWAFTAVDQEQVFEPVGFFDGIFGESFARTAPLRSLIESEIDESTLEAVAREHAAGRRLFIGTTNLDARMFTIWDMGAIASSDSPEKLSLYHDILLASASLPVLFPPVYIPVEGPNGRYWQMHVDGGVRRNAFYFDFVEALTTFDDSIEEPSYDAQLYVLYNGKLRANAVYEPVDPKVTSIATASLAALMRSNTLGNLYALYVHAVISGSDFHITFIPREFPLEGTMSDFDREEMTRLFEFGRKCSLDDTCWATGEAVEVSRELRRALHPTRVDNWAEGRPATWPELQSGEER